MNEATDIAGPNLLEQYGCGPIRFSGHHDALYERHLLFDDVIDPLDAGQRERFEAAARSVRDVLSQRWVETERVYDRENPCSVIGSPRRYASIAGRSTPEVSNIQ